ncbi:unnamed protein product [Heligmosomoides polygyrus]|uniref:Uncharacterized protein n=1 Tax=Heligmosomoides polygyrus TaxID=6339 RepID=A0A183G073_HELPZ|nr:unnamed protein product [Heligmosomoides polygyrus]
MHERQIALTRPPATINGAPQRIKSAQPWRDSVAEAEAVGEHRPPTVSVEPAARSISVQISGEKRRKHEVTASRRRSAGRPDVILEKPRSVLGIDTYLFH